MPRVFSLIVLFCLIALPGTAPAQSDEGLRAVSKGDNRWLWQPVGRLDMTDGTCTASLVTFRHVVTAAHCVHTKKGSELRDPRSIVFRAGLRDGRPYASHRARRILVHPDYDPGDEDRLRQIASDIAIVELQQPIRDKSVRPFNRHDRPHAGESVTVVSYGEDRNDSPAIQDSCALVHRHGDALVYDCAATFGSSGAPVFVMSQSGPQLVSVLSAISSASGTHLSAAAALGDGYRQLIAQILTPEAEVKRVGAGRTSLKQQLGRKTGNRLPQIGQ